MASPGVTALPLGTRTLPQLESNLSALDVVLSTEHLARLEEASAIELAFPHDVLRGDLIRVAVGGGTVSGSDHGSAGFMAVACAISIQRVGLTR